ncbi:response regulator transcription factor [Heliophilum fasciatum]|uniref:Stage 0 sporulation protein A homolog n=1 Tax=Heliophilum fasciatum TaxID=35700 RepID=A0A4R2RWM2_9FIRM|nr:response regulator transcription factor [Heliophilum fasciatum]MCW2278570.1 DNA-binding response OmpR family regulator [Heliophilum fasciatum]TCP63525.1 DNA-binding response OmpR family regulator [Heliophilum fasciatum]
MNHEDKPNHHGKMILVVEDEVKIAEVIRSYLENSGYQVCIAVNVKQALDLFAQCRPALVILDLMLPDMSGEAICSHLRKQSRVPVIMVTAKTEEGDIIAGLEMGADDYVTKPFSPRQLVARVAALLRRSEEALPLARVMTFAGGDLTIDFQSHEIKKSGVLVNLTPNEFKLLSAMLRYPKKVFTREELIYLTMGQDFDGSDRIIDTHIKNLRQKIETDSRNPRYILTVHGVGYRFGGE